MARSRSRLNSAAPYDTHACPPMSRARTRCARIEERTLSIGLGIKRASEREEGGPEFGVLAPSFGGCQAIPIGPLWPHEFLGTNAWRDGVGSSGSAGVRSQARSS